MKKIFLGLLFLCLPFVVKAEVDYEITDYYITSQVEIAGGLKVKELIVLDGNFNGYERKIAFKDNDLKKWEAGKIDYEKSSIYSPYSIDKLKVATFKVSDDVDFKTMNNITDFAQEADQASLGEKEVYTTKATDEGLNVKMYMPAKNEKVAFYLEYVLTNAVVIHEDVAELYYPFIGVNYTDDIKNLNIEVLLPGSDTSDDFRIWAHGPLTGEINKYQNEDKEPIGLIASIKDLKANTGLDIRVTFNKDLIMIPDFLNHSKEEALPKILEVENQRADAANKKRSVAKVAYYSILIGATVYLVVLGGLWIFIYVKYDKEYKSNFKHKYNREFIDDYNVEVVDYLFHKTLTPNALSASIMDLIYKKNIKVEEVNEKKKNYKFTLVNKDNLDERQLYLVEFLFETIGKDNTFTTKDLKKYASSSKYYIFMEKYNNWKNKVIAQGESLGFYENNTNIKIIGALYAFLGLLIFIFNAIMNTDIILAYIIIIPAIIFLIYCLTFNKRSKRGNDDYAKWKAFKRFLEDFGTFETKELPEIILWERYLVYATVFGIAQKVEKAMNVKINDLDPNGAMYHQFATSYMMHHVSVNICSAINDSITSSINSATAHSVSSSGSGAGGGFSSGGFSGGGGGSGF